MTTVLVTGATDGLGRVVASDLASLGFDVLVHGRAAERAEAVASEIGAAGVHLADFSSLAQVRELAASLPHVDVLVNNAGLISEQRVVTGDGIELTFQVNHLAPSCSPRGCWSATRRAGSCTSPRPASSGPTSAT